MSHVPVHDSPEPLDRVEMRAIGRQLDKMDAAVCSGQKGSDIRPFVVGRIIPNNVNDAPVGVACLDFSQKLHSADPIDGGWLDKGRIEGFKVERSMDIHPATSRGGLNGGI